MKLIFCPACNDVVRLQLESWRWCTCGKSGGQYNVDLVTATIGGLAKVFGVANPFFWSDFQTYKSQRARKALRQRYQYRVTDSDCWWGEYEGDEQLFRIESPDGPRLLCELREVSPNEVEVTVVDTRSFTVAGEFKAQVVVPAKMPEGYDGKAA